MKGVTWLGNVLLPESLYPTWFRWKRMYVCVCCVSVCFISHMVQMKASNVYRTRQSKWLYIPHGSDERTMGLLTQRQSLSLYPTWFRWKFSSWLRIVISMRLYIPHGSDESSMRYANEVPGDDLYIPHGSDESLSKVIKLLRLWYLYIPHGSDERYNEVAYHWHLIIFISHMVQMKVTCLRLWCTVIRYFISHMVQMKVHRGRCS